MFSRFTEANAGFRGNWSRVNREPGGQEIKSLGNAQQLWMDEVRK
jgi:hypothetical protein